MGDVGSLFLCVVRFFHFFSRPMFLILALSYYFIDTTYTLIRRLLIEKMFSKPILSTFPNKRRYWLILLLLISSILYM